MTLRGGSSLTPAAFTYGLDNSSPFCTRATEGTLSIASNIDIIDDNMWQTRQGYKELVTWSSYVVRAGFTATKVNGESVTLVYGEASTLTGASGILAKLDGTGTPITIRSGLRDGVKPVFIQIKSRVFIFNGYDDFIYLPDLDTTSQIGISEPANAPTLVTTISGSLNTSGSYRYVYTYYNSLTGAESSPSLPSEILTTGSDSSSAGFTLQVTAGDSDTADTIKIYRTVSGGNIFFLDGTTDISATTYDSTVIDSGLSTRLELDNSRPSFTTRYAIQTDNRVFCAGDKANPNRIQYSKIGLTGAMPESYQVSDFVDCGDGNGDKIIGLGLASDTVIVLKSRSVGRLIRVQANTGGLEITGSQKYIYEEIVGEITAVSHHLITQYSKLCVWVGTNDIYATDGLNILKLGGRITKTIKNLVSTFPERVSVLNDIDNDRIIFSVIGKSKTESTVQLVMWYKNFPKVAYTLYTHGPSSSYPGITAGSLFKVNEGKKQYIYIGNNTGNGAIYRYGGVYHDDGSAIFLDVATPWMDLGYPERQKLFSSLFWYAYGLYGATYTITQIFEDDPEAENTVDSFNESLESNETPLWDSETWDFTWASTSFTRLLFPIHKRAYFGRCRIQQTGISQPLFAKRLSIQAQVHTEAPL